MNTTLTVDRFEGDKLAVLLTADGQPITFPRALLPKSTRPGDILRFAITKDPASTKKVARQTRQVQDELKSTDPGGDIQL